MQCAFFDFVARHGAWCVEPIYAVPNFAGHLGTAASRVRAGAKAKREGRRAGIPDVCVDVARGAWHGLRLEFKTESGRVRPEQKAWHERLRANGYRVEVVRSAEQAVLLLIDYMALK